MLAALAGLGRLAVADLAEPGGRRLPWPLRRVLEFNERVGRGRFAPSLSRRNSRIRGPDAPGQRLDRAGHRTSTQPPGGSTSSDRRGTGRAIVHARRDQGLPRVEMTTELRCIEGWSEVVHWAGARLADLAAATGLATRSGRPTDPTRHADDLLDYAALETPDGTYYVGLDMASALHPQTLLCYEMDGQPLTPEHGAPLRLVIPVKYGIKNLKRIGTIRFTDVRPADYWAERGYDWYAGH